MGFMIRDDKGCFYCNKNDFFPARCHDEWTLVSGGSCKLITRLIPGYRTCLGHLIILVLEVISLVSLTLLGSILEPDYIIALSVTYIIPFVILSSTLDQYFIVAYELI